MLHLKVSSSYCKLHATMQCVTKFHRSCCNLLRQVEHCSTSCNTVAQRILGSKEYSIRAICNMYCINRNRNLQILIYLHACYTRVSISEQEISSQCTKNYYNLVRVGPWLTHVYVFGRLLLLISGLPFIGCLPLQQQSIERNAERNASFMNP